jgi:hypothetical protein
MTYTTLFNQILSYLDRQDADTRAQIPNFISLAHFDISEQAITIGTVEYDSSVFIIGNKFYPKPARWRRTVSIKYGTTVNANYYDNFLRKRTKEYSEYYWPQPALTAPPLFYSDYTFDTFLVSPTPDMAYPFEMGYTKIIDPITANNQTNWLTGNAPNLLLYRCLLNASPYLKNKEDIPVWKEFYQEALDTINKQDVLRHSDRISNIRVD